MPTRHETIDPIANGSNEGAFHTGRWIVLAQGIVFVLAGGGALAMALLGGGSVLVFGARVPAVQAGIIAALGLVSLVCTLRRRWAALLSGVQSTLFWVLFIVSAAVRRPGPWQSVFGDDPACALIYLVVSLLGLVLVLWLFARALSDPDWPHSVMRQD